MRRRLRAIGVRIFAPVALILPLPHNHFCKISSPNFSPQMVLLLMQYLEVPMRTTVTLDDELLAKAVKLTGGLDRSTVLREGLKARQLDDSRRHVSLD
jgi:Bacterial antitoxin of type II TA system, VapB